MGVPNRPLHQRVTQVAKVLGERIGFYSPVQSANSKLLKANAARRKAGRMSRTKKLAAKHAVSPGDKATRLLTRRKIDVARRL